MHSCAREAEIGKPAGRLRVLHHEVHLLAEKLYRRSDLPGLRTGRRRRDRVEPPFGTIKARMGAIRFLMKTPQHFKDQTHKRG